MKFSLINRKILTLLKVQYSNMMEYRVEIALWAISPGIIAFSLYTLTQKYLGASTTGFTLYLFTVYGAFYGIFLFQEKLELFHYIGTILVFIGIFLVKKKIKNA